MLLTLIAMLVLNFSSWAAILIPKAELVSKVDTAEKHQLSKEVQLNNAQLNLLSGMTTEKYETLRGRKLNFFERFAFNASKKRLKKMLTLNAHKDEPNILSKISWFGKGLLLGPLALLVGYLFLKDDDRELIKWIWYGCIGFAAIVAIILLA